MTLLNTAILNGFAVVVKVLTLLGLNKVLAVYIGPTGYAAMGQFQNAVQMITTFASGALNTGVTKYTAEFNGDANKQIQLWKTAGTISLTGTLVAAVVIAFLSDTLSKVLLKN